jgi:hypothetical protein
LIPLVIATCVATLEYRRTGRWFLLVSAGLLAGLAAMTHGNGLSWFRSSARRSGGPDGCGLDRSRFGGCGLSSP